MKLRSNWYIVLVLMAWVLTLAFQMLYLIEGDWVVVAYLTIPNLTLLWIMWIDTRVKDFYWHLIVNVDKYDGSITKFYVDERYYDYHDIIDGSTINVVRIANKDLIINDNDNNVIISSILSSALKHKS